MQFFLQLAAIIFAIRVVGYFGRRFLGQPQVVCEMITGVLLGPSFLGEYFPELAARLFPKETIPVIYSMAQVGLVLYMFLIGNEFRTDIIRRKLKTAAAVSLSGIIVPVLLAFPAAALLVTGEPFFTSEVSLAQRWLFLGAAISITAFPMLARIIYEARISDTSMGTIALAAGSVDDAAA
jgi:Kef-type K+ transport system membrane component KefB